MSSLSKNDRAPYTRLPWILDLLMMNTVMGEAVPCDRCYYPLYAGGARSAVLRVHTNPSPSCVNTSQSMNTEDGKTYWQLENIGKQKLLGECPMKEKWICTEKNPANLGGNKQIYESDLIKEEEIQGVVKRTPDIQLVGGKNLFPDLVEKISQEFNVTNCLICGDTRMAEIWPWEGIPLNPQEILKLLDKEEPGPDNRPEEETWSLRSKVIGEECLWRRGPGYTVYVGELHCKKYLALVEIISNQSSLAIDLLSAQSRQMRTMIYQNRS
ncbi:uncharacterized protein LOC111928849 isoform X2 [Cyanistes caeruleus]|uniref:uncharacterized protein LOC111928849 isoform X2 n=1 Tax=Cyanistes caeruleus TaxID=156563 RepID=UPI000CDA18E9|nr:uncharacterized protein LOC111928849 isoform X2 [Cyanistes caeruleus]